MFLVNTSFHKEILGSLGRPDFFRFNPPFLRKNHLFLMELHSDMFPDCGNLGPWKTDRPYCWVPSSTGLGKISKNIIWTYKVDWKVQANTFKNQGVTHDLSFLSSSKTLTPSKLHQNGCSKLHWSHRN